MEVLEMKMAPNLRFNGFDKEWEQQKLKDVSDIKAGGDLNKEKLRSKGTYPVYTNALTDKGLVGYYDDTFRFEAPAVTVTARGDIGHANARRHNFTPVVRLLTVKSSHNVDFLAEAINIQEPLSEGTGVPQLTVSKLGAYNIKVPSLEEQEKLGNLFYSLSRVIEVETKRLACLKEARTGFLQKMLPVGDVLVPELRFSGFDGDFEVKLTRELGTIGTGKSSKDTKDTNGEYPFYVRSKTVERSNRYLYDEEALLIAKDGQVGKIVHYINGKYDLHHCVFRLHDLIGVNGLYLHAYYSQHFHTHLIPYIGGTTVPSITQGAVLSMPVACPSLEEQEKIGIFFKLLEAKIRVSEAKLAKLTLAKKGFLQQMMV